MNESDLRWYLTLYRPLTLKWRAYQLIGPFDTATLAIQHRTRYGPNTSELQDAYRDLQPALHPTDHRLYLKGQAHADR